tara:strand:+ start:117 stop:1100 length:984 start_codon:yes stop_codon:yes gene_type:complete
MIVKSLEINKIKDIKNFFLFYGKNEGHKNQIIKFLLKESEEIFKYDEKEIIENSNKFVEDILTKSLFEQKKIIIIKRASDKIFPLIEKLDEKKLEDLTVIIMADMLEKKSKLRSFFEKHKKFVSVAYYPDNDQILSKIALNFLRENKIQLSPLNINLIVSKCNGDRENLFNELKKIENYSLGGKKLNKENISKLINLSENHGISTLVDSCLAKNRKKIINILNENNFSSEEGIQITRTFLNKSKRVLLLSENFNENKNIDLTIATARPPIFWKDKEITRQQILNWPPYKIKRLIYRLGELELQIKKNVNNSIILITDFLLDQSSTES